jgi:hypothetical protein
MPIRFGAITVRASPEQPITAKKKARQAPAALAKREKLDGEMPRKSAAELEVECLRLLAMDPHTQGIKRVEIIRLYPKGTGPNRTYGALDPMPTRALA